MSLTSFHPLTYDFSSGSCVLRPASCVLCPGWFPLPVSWAAGCLSLEHSGPDTTLIAYGLFRGTKTDLLSVSWSQGGPSLQFWNKSFSQALTTKLINYYLKLKFSHSWVPPSLWTRKRSLTRTGPCWKLDLVLPSLWHREEWISVG